MRRTALHRPETAGGSQPPGSAWRGRPAISRPAFTLLEVVLAIGLSVAVLYLLSSAIEIYIFRGDQNRQRVEGSQVARAVLDQIAADLAAIRVPPSSTATMAGGGATPGANSGTSTGASSPTSSNASSAANSNPALTTMDQGLVGDMTSISLDRSAYAPWERASRQLDPNLPVDLSTAPVTVRYWFAEGDYHSASDHAALGLSAEPASGVMGLYRETWPTAAASTVMSASPTPATGASSAGGPSPTTTSAPVSAPLPTSSHAELLAPEVIGLEIRYFTGNELLDEWSSTLDGGHPLGVEITLRIVELPDSARSSIDPDEQRRIADGRFRDNEITEYKRFVRLPNVWPSRTALPLAVGQLAQGNAAASATQGSQGAGTAQGAGQSQGAGGAQGGGANGAPSGNGGGAPQGAGS